MKFGLKNVVDIDDNIPPRLFADFNNLDGRRRVRLNTRGTLDDLAALQISLRDGMQVILDDDDEFIVVAIVRQCPVEGWVAEFDWSTIEKDRGSE